MAWICRLLLHLLGWKTIGFEKLPSLKKYIIIVAPHTSNWDFPLGLMVRKACGLDKVKYLGKSSLFRFPPGIIFRALGGYPVERNKSTNLVQSYVDVFNAHEEFAIVMAPEGTRKKVEHFKTGFYFIAKGAGVPIIPCQFDFGAHEVKFLQPFNPTEDPQKDMAYLESLFKGIKGKNTEYNF
ncbi:MAG: 1-acyl-sn-glycerol-3-phosphate acyltransferase [Saprospiraceae bacterium]|nr:1-acyl-sn-glycerol-3-phosphate acyltransferase [Candidatus Vicinibacter affinis]